MLEKQGLPDPQDQQAEVSFCKTGPPGSSGPKGTKGPIGGKGNEGEPGRIGRQRYGRRNWAYSTHRYNWNSWQGGT